jgi:hyperosmotically inducible periplasmic protein
MAGTFAAKVPAIFPCLKHSRSLVRAMHSRGVGETDAKGGCLMTQKKLFGWLGAVALAASTVACAQSDPGITTAVKTKFAADDTVKAYQINVDTKDRVVTLKGEVDTEAAKARAVEVARATEGVRDVVDSMTVKIAATPTTGAMDSARDTAAAAGDMLSDAGITTSVKTKLLADPDVGGLKIDVDTANGVVTLKGNVNSAAERRRAVEVAKGTDGVKSVKDSLKIERR